MKKYLFSLICASVLGTAWGQSPAVVNPAPMAGSQVVPASTSVVMPAMTAAQAAKGGHHGQCDSCAPKTKTVCISEPTVVVRSKVVFSSDCQPFCVKCCFGKKKDCDSCQPKADCAAGCASGLCCGVSQDGGCGHVRMKRELYKRVIKEECPTYKCTPVEVPVCEQVKCAPACAPSCAPACPTTCANGTCGAAVLPGQPAPTMPPATTAIPQVPQGITVAPAVTPTAAPPVAPPALTTTPVFTPLP